MVCGDKLNKFTVEVYIFQSRSSSSSFCCLCATISSNACHLQWQKKLLYYTYIGERVHICRTVSSGSEIESLPSEKSDQLHIEEKCILANFRRARAREIAIVCIKILLCWQTATVGAINQSYWSGD